MTPQEIHSLTLYLRSVFSNENLNVKPRPKQTDSAEVFRDQEHIGLIYRLEDEGELSYSFEMAILDIDLEAAADNA